MKRLLAAVSVLAIASQASAADLAARSAPVYSKAPEYAPVSNWSGWYIGGNVGYGWGSNNTDFSLLPTPAQFGAANTTLKSNTSGVIGGGQVGYNWQIGTFLAGLEADIQGSGVKGSSKIGPIPGSVEAPDSFLSSDHQLSWFGTFRGRLGFTVTPSLLFYGSGGLAYGEVKNDSNAFIFEGTSFPSSTSSTRAGWTAGAGAEWMFAPGWSAKFEYLHLDLGTASATVSSIGPFNPATAQVQSVWHNQFETVRVGVNYHFH